MSLASEKINLADLLASSQQNSAFLYFFYPHSRCSQLLSQTKQQLYYTWNLHRHCYSATAALLLMVCLTATSIANMSC